MDAPAPAPRLPDLVLARLHLRLGSLALARAELETLAGRDALDEDGLVDLAEARWRTGDIAGAGEAAVAALADEEGPLLALVVAAEAAAARGRPTEARRLAEKAMADADGIDRCDLRGHAPGRGLAGRSVRAAARADHDVRCAERGRSSASRRAAARPSRRPRSPAAVPRPPRPSRPRATRPTPARRALAGEAARRPDDGGRHPARPTASRRRWPRKPRPGPKPGLPTPRPSRRPTSWTAAGPRPRGGRPEPAPRVRFALVLRLSPSLAPAVLDLVADRTEPGLALVRGDAYRLVGREIDARRAFGEAARALADRRRRPRLHEPYAVHPDDHPPEGDPT